MVDCKCSGLSNAHFGLFFWAGCVCMAWPGPLCQNPFQGYGLGWALMQRLNWTWTYAPPPNTHPYTPGFCCQNSIWVWTAAGHEASYSLLSVSYGLTSSLCLWPIPTWWYDPTHTSWLVSRESLKVPDPGFCVCHFSVPLVSFLSCCWSKLP